jgi:DNA-binding transcriptional LysR family regulator
VNFEQLQAFLAVLDQGAVARAADTLGVTQSTVSFHLKALESALGTRLMDRTGRRVRATAAGRALVRYARRLVALRDEALARVGATTAGTAGEVRIASSTIPAEYLLPPVLARFHAKNPDVRIGISVSDSKRALASLLDEAFDLALVGTEPRDRRLVAAPFATDEIVLVGSPRSSARGGALARPRTSRVSLSSCARRGRGRRTRSLASSRGGGSRRAPRSRSGAPRRRSGAPSPISASRSSRGTPSGMSSTPGGSSRLASRGRRSGDVSMPSAGGARRWTGRRAPSTSSSWARSHAKRLRRILTLPLPVPLPLPFVLSEIPDHADEHRHDLEALVIELVHARRARAGARAKARMTMP